MRYLITGCIVAMLAILACNKKDAITFPALTDYYPLQVGKTFFYRLDSTIAAPFGTSLITKHFLAKDTVEAKFTDALGKESYRIWRFTTDTQQIQPWKFAATYIATIDRNNKWIEYLDNNMRFIKLKEPLTFGTSWQGNSMIDTRSANSPARYMDGWEYTYQDINKSFTVRKGTFDSTITVLHIDEVVPPGPFNPAFYQQKNYSKEVYAKGVGLIYKEFLHWTWDLNPPPAHYCGCSGDDALGIRLNLVDYK